MGNEKSTAKNEQNNTSATQPASKSTQTKLMQDTKKVLLVHKSDTKEQEKLVEHFEEALVARYPGSVRVETTVNISNANLSDFEGCSWLDEVNNVLLICLTAETIAMLEKIIREKGYIKDGSLNGKVFSVSFGARLQWPPDGVKKGSEHARDFAFNFENMENLKPNDFKKSEKMTALLGAIKGT